MQETGGAGGDDGAGAIVGNSCKESERWTSPDVVTGVPWGLVRNVVSLVPPRTPGSETLSGRRIARFMMSSEWFLNQPSFEN